MVNPIVTINVSQQIAATPSTLQGTGAFLSQGGTTTATGTRTLLTQASDLTAILKGALSLSGITWAANVATATTVAPHGFTTSDTLWLVISGATPATYNGTYLVTVTGLSTFTYTLLTNPGGSTSVAGSYLPESAAELSAMAATFFAQGTKTGVYVLELGPGNPSDGATYLTNYIAASPGIFYSYLVPRKWDADAGFLAMLAEFESTTSKTYFFITSTTGTYNNYTASMKCAFVMIEAPGVSPLTEFSCAAPFWVTLSYNPSSTNKVTPTSFAFLLGVTPYPTVGNAALLQTLKAANVNIVGTGAEGGLSNTILLYGNLKDGNNFQYWYSVDWVQINIDLAVSNAIINGSNDPANPLYYNQDGINRLQAVAASEMASGVSFGLVLGQVIQTQLDSVELQQALSVGTYAGLTLVNAIPFVPYGQANPSDYKNGIYSGYTIVYVPARGFISIVFNVIVTQFTTP